MIERNGYAGFSAFPAEAGTVGPHRPIDALTQSTRVTLSGNAFTVRVQISNAQSQTRAPHLFVPPDDSFETFATLTPPAAPLSIPGPARFVRLIVDSGEVTDAHIEESQVDAWGANLEAVTQRAEDAALFAAGAVQALDDGASGLLALANATQQALDNLADSKADLEQTQVDMSALVGLQLRANLAAITGADGLYKAIDTGYVYQRSGGVNTRRAELEPATKTQLGVITAALGGIIRADLAAKSGTAGPQFADGHRWIWKPTGSANGGAFFGTKVEAAGGGIWQRDTTETPNALWWGITDDGVTNNTPRLQQAVDALGYFGELYFPYTVGYYGIMPGLVVTVPFSFVGAGRNQSRLRMLSATGEFIGVRSDGAVKFASLGFVPPAGQKMAYGSIMISLRGSVPGKSNASSLFENCSFLSHWCAVDAVAASGYEFVGCVFNDLQSWGYHLRLRNIWNSDSGDGSITRTSFSPGVGTNNTRAVLYQSGGGLKIAGNNKFYPHTFGLHLKVLPSTGTGIMMFTGASCEAQQKTMVQMEYGTADQMWKPGRVYAIGDRVQPDMFNQYFYVATTGGTAGATYPAWPTAADGTVADGGVTWKAQPIEPADRKSSTAYTVGQYVRKPFTAEYIYRCTVAGTSGASEPAWPVSPPDSGGTLADGGVTWEIIPCTTPLRWVAGKTYDEGQVIRPPTPNGYWYAAGITANTGTTGASGATEPAWPATGIRATVVDSGVTWVAVTPWHFWVKSNIQGNQFANDFEASVRVNGDFVVKDTLVDGNQFIVNTTNIAVDLVGGLYPSIGKNHIINAAVNNNTSGGTGVRVGMRVIGERVAPQDTVNVQTPLVDLKGTVENHYKPLALSAGWVTATALSKNAPPMFVRQSINGMDRVTLTGSIANATAGSAIAGQVATLPVGFRPAGTVHFAAQALTGGGSLERAVVEVRSTGAVLITQQIGNTSSGSIQFLELGVITFTVQPIY